MQELVIKVADDIAAAIASKVSSGEFKDAAAVVEDSLRRLLEGDQAFERWLNEEVLPSVSADDGDSLGEIPIEDVLPRLRARLAAGEFG